MQHARLPCPWDFPRWSGLPFPSPGNPPDPAVEPGYPTLQEDSLPLSHLGGPWKGKDSPHPGTRFNHSQLILLKTAGSQDPDARPKGCKKLVRQRPCHGWHHPQCMIWRPGWVCTRPGHRSVQAVACVWVPWWLLQGPFPPPHHRYWLPHKLMV